MNAVASQHREHQSPGILVHCEGLHWWSVDPPHKGPVMPWCHHCKKEKSAADMYCWPSFAHKPVLGYLQLQGGANIRVWLFYINSDADAPSIIPLGTSIKERDQRLLSVALLARIIDCNCPLHLPLGGYHRTLPVAMLTTSPLSHSHSDKDNSDSIDKNMTHWGSPHRWWFITEWNLWDKGGSPRKRSVMHLGLCSIFLRMVGTYWYEPLPRYGQVIVIEDKILLFYNRLLVVIVIAMSIVRCCDTRCDVFNVVADRCGFLWHILLSK